MDQELSAQQIQEEISKLDQEIIDLQGQLEHQHEEIGNSPEDTQSEAEIDEQNRGVIAFQLENKRRRVAELREMMKKAV